LAVLYPVPESRKMAQERRAVVDVPSVCQHIRCGTDRPWFRWTLFSDWQSQH